MKIEAIPGGLEAAEVVIVTRPPSGVAGGPYLEWRGCGPYLKRRVCGSR